MIFPDFSSLFKIPWLENAFPFFQVFQSEWENPNLISGGSRISQERGTNPVGGQPTIWRNFCRKLYKKKKEGKNWIEQGAP